MASPPPPPWPERAAASAGMCSPRMKSDMSGEQPSTAAENVCRRQTEATVGSPAQPG